MATISFVVAVYRNEGAVSRTYAQIRDTFASSLPDDTFEMIFVDDGSDDGSLAEVLALRDQDSRVKVITFTRNFGQMAAITAGLQHATGDATINISADLQDPAELIPEMVNRWKEGSEIVVCHRTDRADTLSAKLFSRVAYKALRLSIPSIPPGGFDFVLIDRVALDQYNDIDVRNRFFQGDLLWAGFRTSFIPYVRLKRTIGRSQYNWRKKLKNFLDAFLDASYLPIRFISAAGLVTSMLGILYAISVLISALLGHTPFDGWAPIMVVLLVIGGMTMLMLGIIGEYIWRIYDELRGKPNYVVRDKWM